MSTYHNTVEYITIDTPGNVTDFGNLTDGRYGLGAASNGTRGVFAGGRNSTVNTNTIDYITINTTGNATDFGDLTAICVGLARNCQDGTRGVFGSVSAGASNIIEYITISTPGNSTDFGDLTTSRDYMGGLAGD